MGFTSKYVVGVWMGLDDNMPLKGVVGGNLPAKIWREIIENIHDEIPSKLPTLSTKEYNKSIISGSEAVLIENGNGFENSNILRRFYYYLKNFNE